MPFCNSCGANMEGAATFCSNCGAPVGSPSRFLDPPSERRKLDKRWIAGIVAAVVLVVLLDGYHIRQQAFRDAEASEYAEKMEREKQAAEQAKAAAQQAKAAQENAQFEQLPIEAKGRIAFAQVINAAFHKEGTLIGVQATGENFDTLELSSALIFEGSHTLTAAREILDPTLMKNMKKLGFKKIIIKSPDSSYWEGYTIE